MKGLNVSVICMLDAQESIAAASEFFHIKKGGLAMATLPGCERGISAGSAR